MGIAAVYWHFQGSFSSQILHVFQELLVKTPFYQIMQVLHEGLYLMCSCVL